MPFFLKPCMRFRKKNKKDRKAIEKIIEPFNDVTETVTADEILESCRSKSRLSIANETESIDDNDSEPVSAGLTLENNLTGASVSSSTDETNHNLSPPAISEDEDNQDVISDELSSESVDSTINNNNEEVSNLTIKEDEQHPDNDAISVSQKNKKQVNSVTENLQINLNNDDTDKIIQVEKSSNGIVEADTHSEKIASIIKNVTVCSNVFEIIEQIKEIQSAECTKNETKEKDKIIDKKPVDMEEIRAVLYGMIDKLHNLQNIENNPSTEDYKISKHSIEKKNESTYADLIQSTPIIRNQGDQLAEAKLDVCISETHSLKPEQMKKIINHGTGAVVNISVSNEGIIVNNKEDQKMDKITDVDNTSVSKEELIVINKEDQNGAKITGVSNNSVSLEELIVNNKEDQNEAKITGIGNNSVWKEGKIVNNKEDQNKDKITVVDIAWETPDKTKMQFNCEANNSCSKIILDKICNELNFEVLSNAVTENSEKLDYVGDGIEKISETETHQKCAQENEINESGHQQFQESIYNTPNNKNCIWSETDAFLNTDDKLLNTDEVEQNREVSLKEKNKTNNESKLSVEIQCGTSEESDVRDSLNFPNSVGVANRNDCEILQSHLLPQKSEIVQNQKSLNHNELTFNTLPLGIFENETISKVLTVDNNENEQVNQNSVMPSDFDFTAKKEMSFGFSVSNQTLCTQPISATFNITQDFDDIDDTEDSFKEDFQNMTLLEAEDTISTEHRDQNNLTYHSDKFINMHKSDEQIERKHDRQSEICDRFSKNVIENKCDISKRKQFVNLYEKCSKPQECENDELQERRHSSVLQKEGFNINSDIEMFSFNQNKMNECQQFSKKHFNPIEAHDNEYTSKPEIENVLQEWATEGEFQEDEDKNIHEIERDTNKNTTNKGKSIISEIDKELSQSKNIYIKSYSGAEYGHVSSDEEFWNDGMQARNNVYRRKKKVRSQSREMEILREFPLNLDDINNENINVDTEVEPSTRNCCDNSNYKCRKSISLPFHTNRDGGFKSRKNCCCNKINFCLLKDNFLTSNNIKNDFVKNVPDLDKRLTFKTSDDQDWADSFHNREGGDKTIYTDSSADSMSDEKSSGGSQISFMKHLLNYDSSELANHNFHLSTEELMQKDARTPYANINVSNSDIINCLDNSVLDNNLLPYYTDRNQCETLNGQQENINISIEERCKVMENDFKHEHRFTPIKNGSSNFLTMDIPRDNRQNIKYSKMFDNKYEKPVNFECITNSMDDGLHKNNNKYFSTDSRYDHRSLNKYSVSSLSFSSESSKLSDSGDAKEVDKNVKQSESFIISAAGDNKEESGKAVNTIDGLKTHRKKFPNENDYKKGQTTVEIDKSKSQASTTPCQLKITMKHKKDSLKKKDVHAEHKNYILDSNLKTIEVKRRKSIEAFRRQKLHAMLGMRPNLRVIPIRRAKEFEFKLSDIENEYNFRNKIKNEQGYLTPNSDNKSNINESTTFSVQSEIAGYQMSIRTPVGKIKFQTTVKGDNTDQISTEFTESENELLSSQASLNMTPARKKILNASRAIRSPKYPVNVGPNGNYLHRKNPVIFSKENLVAYVTKDEKNKSYKVRKGYPICDTDLDNYEYRIGNSKKMIIVSPSNRRNQSNQAKTHRATSPDDLRIQFDDKFKRYAGTGRTNGELISYKRSTEWLKDAGLVGKVLTVEEANAAFKVTAGLKVALNRGDYRHFLKKLSRLKQLNYNNIYERLCLASNK